MVQEAVRVLGQSSNFRRNEIMLSYHRPGLVVSFALSFDESSVVFDIMKRAEKKGIKARAVEYERIVRRNSNVIPPIRLV